MYHAEILIGNFREMVGDSSVDSYYFYTIC